MKHLLSSTLLASIFVTVAAAESKNHWSGWRGPHENGSIQSGNYPVKWDADTVLWKAPLPGKGFSTPIVWEDRIFLTAPVDGENAVLAFDLTGQLIWRTTLGPEDPGKHRNGSGSNPSPVTDGEGVYVSFKSGHFAALELDGKVRWQANLAEQYGPVNLFWDHGTSPVLTDQSVIMARMHGGDSWLAAFDKATGEVRWKVPRNYETPTEVDNGYTTPLIIRHEGKEAVLTWGAQHVTVHDAADGKLLWSCGGFNPGSNGFWPAVASPVIAGDTAVVCFGRADRGQPRLHGVKLGGSGDVTGTHRAWMRDDVGAFVPTPASYQGRVYVVSDRGEIECLDPATGQTIWKDAFPKHRSNYYASPLIADGKIYAAREDGTVFVAQVTDKFELLAENDMGERIIASPVPASNHLLIRGEKHLFCIAAPES